MTKLYRVYKIENKYGDIVYVGQTSQNSLEMRLEQHKTDYKHEEKMNYLNNPINGCIITELHKSEFDYDLTEWEQFYIDLYKNNNIWFNRIRAKKLTSNEKYKLGKALKKGNNTNNGEFEFDNFSDGDLFN